MSEDRVELPQGTLDLLILKTLAVEPKHGWERHQDGRAGMSVRQAWTISFGATPNGSAGCLLQREDGTGARSNSTV